MTRPIKPTHQHYKGGCYKLLCRAVMERNGEAVVVYRSVDTGQTWVRPASEFDGVVEPFGGRRFEPIEEARDATK